MTLSVIVAYAVGILLILLVGRFLVIPVKIILSLIYNGLIGGLVLWLVNLIGGPLGVAIPITIWSALLVGLLGVPGVAVLIVYYMFLVGKVF